MSSIIGIPLSTGGGSGEGGGFNIDDYTPSFVEHEYDTSVTTSTIIGKGYVLNFGSLMKHTSGYAYLYVDEMNRLGSHKESTSDNLSSIQYDSVNEQIYALCSGTNQIGVMDVADEAWRNWSTSGTWDKKIDTSSYGTTEYDICLNPDMHELYVMNKTTLVIIDLDTNTITGSETTAGNLNDEVYKSFYDPVDQEVWITTRNDTSLYAYDPVDWSTTHSITGMSYSGYHVVHDAANDDFIVSHINNSRVGYGDSSTDSYTGSFTTASNPRMIGYVPSVSSWAQVCHSGDEVIEAVNMDGSPTAGTTVDYGTAYQYPAFCEPYDESYKLFTVSDRGIGPVIANNTTTNILRTAQTRFAKGEIHAKYAFDRTNDILYSPIGDNINAVYVGEEGNTLTLSSTSLNSGENTWGGVNHFHKFNYCFRFQSRYGEGWVSYLLE